MRRKRIKMYRSLFSSKRMQKIRGYLGQLELRVVDIVSAAE